MEEQAEYKVGQASLFHAIAVEVQPIWRWCPVCWDRTNFDFLKDDGLDEVYRCENCNHIHRIRVR